MSIYDRIMDATGSDRGGGFKCPPEARTVYYSADGSAREVPRGTREAYVLASNNDGFELWFGTRDRWFFHMRQPEVRLLTRYLIWDWYVKSRWLGLRRPVYYWALRHHVRRFRKES